MLNRQSPSSRPSRVSSSSDKTSLPPRKAGASNKNNSIINTTGEQQQRAATGDMAHNTNGAIPNLNSSSLLRSSTTVNMMPSFSSSGGGGVHEANTASAAMGQRGHFNNVARTGGALPTSSINTYIPRYVAEQEKRDGMSRWVRTTLKSDDDTAGLTVFSGNPKDALSDPNAVATFSSTDKRVKSKVFDGLNLKTKDGGGGSSSLSTGGGGGSSKRGFTEEELEMQYSALACVWRRVDNSTEGASPSAGKDGVAAGKGGVRFGVSPSDSTPSRQSHQLRPLSRGGGTVLPSPSDVASRSRPSPARAMTPQQQLQQRPLSSALKGAKGSSGGGLEVPSRPSTAMSGALGPHTSISPMKNASNAFYVTAPEPPPLRKEDLTRPVEQTIRSIQQQELLETAGIDLSNKGVGCSSSKGAMRDRWVNKKANATGHPPVLVEDTPMLGGLQRAWASGEVQLAPFRSPPVATGAPPSMRRTLIEKERQQRRGAGGEKRDQQGGGGGAGGGGGPDSSSDDDDNGYSSSPSYLLGPNDTGRRRRTRANRNTTALMKEIDRFEAFNQETILPANFVALSGGSSDPLGQSQQQQQSSSSRPSSSSLRRERAEGPKPVTIAFEDSSDEEYFVEKQGLKDAIVQQALDEIKYVNSISNSGGGGASSGGLGAASAIARRKRASVAGGTVPNVLGQSQHLHASGGGGGGVLGLSERNKTKFVVERRAKDSLQLFNATFGASGGGVDSGGSRGNSPSGGTVTAGPSQGQARGDASLTASASMSTAGNSSRPTTQKKAVGFSAVVTTGNSATIGNNSMSRMPSSLVLGGTMDSTGEGRGNDASLPPSAPPPPQFFAADAVDILREVYRTACPLHQDREDAYVQALGGLSFPMTYRKFRELVRRLVEAATGGNAIAFSPGSFRKPAAPTNVAITRFIHSEAVAKQLVPPPALAGSHGKGGNTITSNNAPHSSNGGFGLGAVLSHGDLTCSNDSFSYSNSLSTSQALGPTTPHGGSGSNLTPSSAGGGGGGTTAVGFHPYSSSYGQSSRDRDKVKLMIPDDVFRAMYTTIVEKAQLLPSAPQVTAAAHTAKSNAGLPIQLTPIIPYVGYLHAICQCFLSPKQATFTHDIYHHIRNSPHISYYLYHLRQRVLVKMQRRLMRQLKIVQKINVMEAMVAAVESGGASALTTLIATMRSGAMGPAAASLLTVAGVASGPTSEGGSGSGGGSGLGSSSLNATASIGLGGRGVVGGQGGTASSANPNQQLAAAVGGPQSAGGLSFSSATAAASAYANPLTAPLLTRDQKVDYRTLEALRSIRLDVGTEPHKLLTLTGCLEYSMLGDPIEEGAKARLWHKTSAELLARQTHSNSHGLASGGHHHGVGSGGGGGGGGGGGRTETYAESMAKLGIPWGSASGAGVSANASNGSSNNSGSTANTTSSSSSSGGANHHHHLLYPYQQQHIKTEEEVLDEALRDVERRLELINSSAADTFKASNTLNSPSPQGSGGGGSAGGGAAPRTVEIRDQLLLSVFLPKKVKDNVTTIANGAATHQHQQGQPGSPSRTKGQGSRKPPVAGKSGGSIERETFHFVEDDSDLASSCSSSEGGDSSAAEEGEERGRGEDGAYRRTSSKGKVDRTTNKRTNSSSSRHASGKAAAHTTTTNTRKAHRHKHRHSESSGSSGGGASRYEPTKFATFIVRDVVFSLKNVSIQFPHPEEDALVKAIVQSLSSTALDTATTLISDEAEARRKQEEERVSRAKLMSTQNASIAAMMDDWGGAEANSTSTSTMLMGGNRSATTGRSSSLDYYGNAKGTAAAAAVNRTASSSVAVQPYRPPLHPPPMSYITLDNFRMLLFCDDKAMGALETVCPAEKTVVDGAFSQYA